MKKFTGINSIGIWMDFTEAKLIFPGKPSTEIRSISSPVNTHVRIAGESPDGIKMGRYRSSNNEFSKHQIYQNEVHSYFKQLAAELQPYDEILIFGPAPARKEFHHFLQKDKHFLGKRIISKPVDYLTENQLVEFVMKNLS